MLGEEWQGVLSELDPQIEYLHKSSYTRTITRKSLVKKQPWVTTGLITSIKRRDWMKSKLKNEHSIKARQRFVEYRNMLNTLIKETKKSYCDHQLRLAGNDSKTIWKTINQRINRGRNKTKVSDEIIDDEGNPISDSAERANTFNSFFINIGGPLANKIHRPDIDSLPGLPPHPSSIYF